MGMIQSSINNLLTTVGAFAAFTPEGKLKKAKEEGIARGVAEVTKQEVISSAEQKQRQKDIEQGEAAWAQKHKQFSEDLTWKTGAKGQATKANYQDRLKKLKSLQKESHDLWMQTGKQEYYDIQSEYAKLQSEYEEGINSLKRPPKNPQDALETAQNEQRNGKMNGGNK